MWETQFLQSFSACSPANHNFRQSDHSPQHWCNKRAILKCSSKLVRKADSIICTLVFARRKLCAWTRVSWERNTANHLTCISLTFSDFRWCKQHIWNSIPYLCRDYTAAYVNKILQKLNTSPKNRTKEPKLHQLPPHQMLLLALKLHHEIKVQKAPSRTEC